MRSIIHRVDLDNRIFFIKQHKKLEAFYLTNRLSKLFLPLLKQGVLIDFYYKPKLSKINGYMVKSVTAIDQIITLSPYHVLHDMDDLRSMMTQVISSVRHYLFMDFEMSMPPYGHKGFFQTEIIQIGMVLTDAEFNIIKQHQCYVELYQSKLPSDRTMKFLDLDITEYVNKKQPFHTMYELLKNWITMYQPKFVVWGKNDIQVLEEAYQLHQMPKLTSSKNFIDLLKIHKDYYQLKDDLGLFKAHEMYYQTPRTQAHDALADAHTTYEIMRGFMKKNLFKEKQ
jgi:sporulation inhibitor KapD